MQTVKTPIFGAMKKKRLTLIIVIALILASLYYLFFGGGFSTLGEQDNDFAVADTGSITKIFIADKRNNSVTLTRVNGGEWMVNGHYIARQDCINNLLVTIKMLAVKNLIDPRGFPTVVKNLASNATKVEIYMGDKRVKMYYVGGPTQDQTGTFMLLANHRTGVNYSQPYIMYIPGFDGYLTSRYFISETDWRDRTILRCYPYQLKSVQVDYPQSDSGFAITILGRNRFAMSDPMTKRNIPAFDTVAVKQYLTYYQTLSWEAEAGTSKKDSIINSGPFAIITVLDTAGKRDEIKLFHRNTPEKDKDKYGIAYKYDPDRMYALVNGKDFVIIQYYVFGKLLQSSTYFTHERE